MLYILLVFPGDSLLLCDGNHFNFRLNDWLIPNVGFSLSSYQNF